MTHDTSSATLIAVWMEKVERNALFEAVVAGGLDPMECRLEEHSSFWTGATALLTHQPSQSYFKIIRGTKPEPTRAEPNPDRSYHYQRVVSGGPKTSEKDLTGSSSVTELVRKWASEINAPDLWVDLRNTKFSLSDAQEGSPENTPFTVSEQLQISNLLRETKAYVKQTYQLSDTEFARIEERLDEAEEASRRIGRKDWILLFSGLALTLIVTDLVTPGVAQHILTMGLHGLGNLFGQGAKPISGPQQK